MMYWKIRNRRNELKQQFEAQSKPFLIYKCTLPAEVAYWASS